MSHWRVQRHYGFGAGRIAIQPEPHRAGRASVRVGLAAIGEELTDGGPLASLRRLGGELPALLLGLLILSAFIVTLARDHSDRSAIEVVVLQDRPEPVLVEVEEPVPVEIPVPVEAPVEAPVEVPVEPRVAEVVPQMRPEPKPELTPRPAPRPAPKAIPRPRPALPPPPIRERPVERPVERLAERPPAPSRSQLPPKPRVAIEPAASEPRRMQPEAAPQPPSRRERLAVARPAPSVAREIRPSAPAAPDVARPAAPPPSSRSFRVATAAPASGERPRPIPGLAPPAVAPAAAATLPRAEPASGPVARAERRPVPRVETRAAPRLAAAPARAAAPPVAPPPSLPNRVARAAADPSVGVAHDRPGLAGVPLGDLAACVSDREEDRLKQAVVAAVTTQDECVSRSGRYRFVQTRNLNAFLMWIDRAPGRSVEDRCGELRNALQCLSENGRRAAR